MCPESASEQAVYRLSPVVQSGMRRPPIAAPHIPCGLLRVDWRKCFRLFSPVPTRRPSRPACKCCQPAACGNSCTPPATWPAGRLAPQTPAARHRFALSRSVRAACSRMACGLRASRCALWPPSLLWRCACPPPDRLFAAPCRNPGLDDSSQSPRNPTRPRVPRSAQPSSARDPLP